MTIKSIIKNKKCFIETYQYDIEWPAICTTSRKELFEKMLQCTVKIERYSQSPS